MDVNCRDVIRPGNFITRSHVELRCGCVAFPYNDQLYPPSVSTRLASHLNKMNTKLNGLTIR